MKTLLLTILLLSFGQAQASFYIGRDLLKDCEASIELERVGGAKGGWEMIADTGNCIYFIGGVYDSHRAFVDWKNMDKRWCAPEKEIYLSQLARIVAKYLQERPEQLHFNAGGLVANAFNDAFPCGGES